MDITKSLNVAFECLAQTSNTKEEIVMALKAQQFPEAVIKKTITRLEELNMIGDQAVAEQLLQRYPDRGNQWQMVKLRQRGVHEGIALQKIQQQVSEFERALLAAKHKSQFLTDISDQEKKQARLMRFLMGRGFPEEISVKVTEEVL